MKRRIEKKADDIEMVAAEYRLRGNTLLKAYKNVLSDFRTFERVYREALKKGEFVFAKNLGSSIGIDETGLFKGELYTIVFNKDNSDGKNRIVAMVRGTQSKKVVDAVTKEISFSDRMRIKDVTIDFANSMDWISRQLVPNGMTVYDRFHLERLVFDALQSLRILHRWEVLDEEADGGKTVKLSNGETRRQVLARSRYLLFKQEKNWTKDQKRRAAVLFREYPDIEDAYLMVMEFKEFFSMKRDAAEPGMKEWITRALTHPVREFRTLGKTIKSNLGGILNYFDGRKTNALLENFNGKIKQFLREVRGGNDKNFFFYRLFSLYAW